MARNKNSKPWVSGEWGSQAKKHAPATARNRDAIAAVLARELPHSGTVLEIASGSGEHILHFARMLPELDWQPSDPDPACRVSITAWLKENVLHNVADPIDLDASTSQWPVEDIAAILCINMIHISPWAATMGLLAGAGRLLAPGEPLYLYGPFRMAGRTTAPSNEAFDRSLRSRNPQWGLRHLEEVENEAHSHGLARTETIDMPANNISVIFRKTG
ncbi:DUF938 domain-containing protein [Parasphingopyxis lamellibrachiae]|uniref:Uncharacterized protein DUF938 n=1 Tax=Parasphingopyxis lamellibrachiae TaxID=680125 RepID=A0A3D9FE10_9SPHN|nr:DUF938 domain-containing protein [Parasphingopyxis lamellibrachiae]RED15281.1 uncharacterized protein DUF938 [Parasphingopyxis lamellibrachiae]